MIYLSPPHLGSMEEKRILQALKENALGYGRFIDEFESSVAKYARVKHALALCSASAALHLALRVAGVGDEDVVLASSFTFIGSVGGACQLGARLVFIDCDDSFNVDLSLLKQAIKKHKPKAFILTYLYGNSPQMDEITKLCKENKVCLIEDSAEALGSFYKGRAAGSFGDFGVYSFNANKIVTCAGGGILLAKNKSLLEKARFFANQAKEDKPYYEHKEYGYNYRLSNLNAALGVSAMELIEQRVLQKRTIFSTYKKALSEYFDFVDEREFARDNKWLSTVVFKDKWANERRVLALIKCLKDENIEARMLWKPMHTQELFKGNEAFLNGKSEMFFRNGLCLPSGSELSKQDLDKICEICIKVAKIRLS